MRNGRMRTGSTFSKPRTKVDNITCKECGLTFGVLTSRRLQTSCPYCNQPLTILPTGKKYVIDWRHVC